MVLTAVEFVFCNLPPQLVMDQPEDTTWRGGWLGSRDVPNERRQLESSSSSSGEATDPLLGDCGDRTR